MSQPAQRDTEAWRRAGLIVTEDTVCPFCKERSPNEPAHTLCVQKAQIDALERFSKAVERLERITAHLEPIAQPQFLKKLGELWKRLDTPRKAR